MTRLVGSLLCGFALASETRAALIRSGAGADGPAIQATVDQFRADLGPRREINWDGVPDNFAAPNFLPGDFFNSRGAFFSTPGEGVQVSADSSNPTGTPVRFGNINPTYPDIFKTFSAERLFSPIGSTIVDLSFFLPGTTTPALVKGFGAVYADADVLDATSFQYFDALGNSLGTFSIPPSNNGLSFLGVSFDTAVIRRVRIVYGNSPLGPDDGNGIDVAVMDDFIYGEPEIAGTTRVWTNVVGNANWSNAANWSNGVPVDGDSVLLLRHPLGFSVNAVNDLTNLTVQAIRCEALGYTLGGGALRLIGDVLMGGPAAGANLNIRAPVEIVGPTVQIVSTNSSGLTLSGVVNSPASNVVTIEGGISFQASPASDYRAETRLRSGTVLLLFTRIGGPLIVGGTTNAAFVVLQSGTLFGNFPPLTLLTNGALLNISTLNSVGPLTVNGGVLRTGNRSPQGEITVNGNALLTGGASLFVSAINSFGPGDLSVTGSVTLAGCSLAFQPGSGIFTQPAVIVRNDGIDPVIGTFSDLPEGSVLTNGSVRYTLSYVGGDGNDITLSPIIEPPQFIAATQTDGVPQFTVQGQPGFTYVIEAATNLLSPPALIPWVPIRTNGTLANGQFPFTDTDATNFPQRFYRAVKP